MIYKFLFNRTVCIFLFVILFGFLENTSFQAISIQLNLIIKVFYFFLFFYFLIVEKYNNRFFSKTYLTILFLIPLFYIAASMSLFNQSFLDGFKSSFIHYGFLTFIYLFYFFKKNKNLIFFEKLVFFCGWAFIILSSIIKITFPDYEYTIQSFDGSKEYLTSTYKISSPIIIWLGYVYLMKYKLRNFPSDLFKSIIFLIYPIIFFNARGYIVTLFCVLTFLFFKNLKLHRLVNLFLFLLFFFPFFYSLISSSEFFSQKFMLIQEAFKVTFNYSNSSNDMSSNFRLIQFYDVIPFIRDNIFTGIGFLNDYSIYFDYLHPSDIGIIGIVFNFGLIGLFIFSYQLIVLRKIIRLKYFNHNNSFLNGSIITLLHICIGSLFTGFFVFNITVTFIIFSVAIFFNSNKFNNDSYSIN